MLAMHFLYIALIVLRYIPYSPIFSVQTPQTFPLEIFCPFRNEPAVSNISHGVVASRDLQRDVLLSLPVLHHVARSR